MTGQLPFIALLWSCSNRCQHTAGYSYDCASLCLYFLTLIFIVCGLQCVCTTLMKQRDEQHHYFSQRELTLNCNNSQKVDKIYKEKVAAVTQCTSLKIDFELLRSEW